MAFADKKKEQAYVNQYQKDNYDRITVMANKGCKAEWKKAADLKGLSLSNFVMACVEAELNRMKEI